MPAGYATTLNGDELNDLITFLMFTARDAKTDAALPKSPRTMKKRENRLSFARTLQGHKSRPVTMLQTHPHAIHFTHSGFWRGTRNYRQGSGTCDASKTQSMLIGSCDVSFEVDTKY